MIEIDSEVTSIYTKRAKPTLAFSLQQAIPWGELKIDLIQSEMRRAQEGEKEW